MSASDSNARPHRRLSLTLPTTPNLARETDASETDASIEAAAPVSSPPDLQPEPASDSPADTAKDAISDGAVAPAATVRVMAYLTEDEARLLDEIWFSLRRDPARPSKSDILRAALTIAATDRKRLGVMLSEQQHSTLSRQRSSKIRAKSAG